MNHSLLNSSVVAFQRLRQSHIDEPEWTHRMHLLSAWGMLAEHSLSRTGSSKSTQDFERLFEMFSDLIRKLNLRNGIPNNLERGYHYTITRYWLLRLYALFPDHQAFAAFLNRPEQSGAEAISVHYSQALIYSSKARGEWVDPDRNSLGDFEGIQVE